MVQCLLIVSCVDAFILTVKSSFSDEGVDKVDGHLRKLLSDIFSSLLPIAFSQLIETVLTFVLHWCPDKLEVSSSEPYARTFSAPISSFRDGTVEWFLPSSKRQVTAVSSN